MATLIKVLKEHRIGKKTVLLENYPERPFTPYRVSMFAYYDTPNEAKAKYDELTKPKRTNKA